eukprot:829894_1
MAAYARAKHISITYVLMPVYSEQYFHRLTENIHDDKERVDVGNTSNEQEEGKVNEGDKERTVCMSVESLGPTVANIFDSYEVYSGHEIGLMTDIMSIDKATEIVHQVFF